MYRVPYVQYVHTTSSVTLNGWKLNFLHSFHIYKEDINFSPLLRVDGLGYKFHQRYGAETLHIHQEKSLNVPTDPKCPQFERFHAFLRSTNFQKFSS